MYELETGVAGERMPMSSAPPWGETSGYYWESVEQEEDEIYQSTLVKAPDRWLWSLLFAPATKSGKLKHCRVQLSTMTKMAIQAVMTGS